MRHAGLLAVGFVILCAAVVVIALRQQLIAAIVQATDRSPPQATFHFRTQDGRIFQDTITVQPGEPFVPLFRMLDNADPSPTATVWLSPSAGNLGQPVTLGNWMILEEPGTWQMHARVADASGNTTTYSTLINVFNNPPSSTTAESTDQKKSRNSADGMIVADSDETYVTGNIQHATSPGVAAAIDSIELIQNAQGVHSLDVTVILGSNSDLSKLNRSYLCLFPLDEIKRPTPHFDWELIPATDAVYVPDKNIWRMQFK